MQMKPSTAQASIHDIYVLVEAEGQKVKTNKTATIEINLSKMEMMGNDGCNDFGGKISMHNADQMILEFADINATEMYCDEVSNKIGQSLYKVKKYKREGMLLHLMSEEGSVLLTYKKVD